MFISALGRREIADIVPSLFHCYTAKDDLPNTPETLRRLIIYAIQQSPKFPQTSRQIILDAGPETTAPYLARALGHSQRREYAQSMFLELGRSQATEDALRMAAENGAGDEANKILLMYALG